MSVQIYPSILSADFCDLKNELNTISTADGIHIDVMDYHFVPNLTIGEPVVQRLCEIATLPTDIHLMIENPDRWAINYAAMGATSITFHMGATAAPIRLARQLHTMGAQACFAIRPSEPVEPLFDILNEFDTILIMTVEPGFGGQKFLNNQLNKIARLRQEITRQHLTTHIEVDGGINLTTAPLVTKAGADILVAGSSIFNSANRTQMITNLRQTAQQHYRA
ncbi:MAG: ribulose-phosphate 3-epimerase [Aeriscardovia sp.]|nr:ribulose-phosphate 3-epimerase [Aeriscardovia sp.]MBO5633442.1 ribulose-phosphate 3-epimerase [Aeriscardovia sp.]